MYFNNWFAFKLVLVSFGSVVKNTLYYFGCVYPLIFAKTSSPILYHGVIVPSAISMIKYVLRLCILETNIYIVICYIKFKIFVYITYLLN